MNYEFLMEIGIILLLFWLINRREELRYRQGVVLLLALAFYLFFIYLYFDLHIFQNGVFKDSYQQLASSEAYQEYTNTLSQIKPLFDESAKKISGHQEKLPLMNELILLSVLGLLLFLCLKIVIIAFTALWDLFVKPKTKLGFFSTFFYEVKHGKVYIKDTYILLGIIAKYFGSFLFLLTFLLPYAAFYAYRDVWFDEEIELFLEYLWPPLILFASIILMETGFFLDGLKKNVSYGDISVQKNNVDLISKFDYLYKRYHEALGEKILAGHIIKDLEQDVDRYNTMIPSYDIPYLNEAVRVMLSEGKEVNIDYMEGLDRLFSWRQQGRKPNVLFSNAQDEQFAPYLRLFFEFSYLTNKKVIIPVLTEKQRERTTQWIKELVGEEVFYVQKCRDFKYKEERYHILVDTLENIIENSTLEKYLIDFHFMVLFDLKNFIRRNHLYLNTFLKLYQAITNKSPQILGFSNIPNELEPSFNLLFVGANDDTAEIKIKKAKEKALYIIVFDANGPRFQDLLSLDKGLYLGREIPLAYFANKEGGISPVIISSETSSLEEELEEICKNTECSIGFKSAVKQIDNRYFNHLTDEDRLFVVDDCCNMVQTILKWHKYILSKEIFLIIVSPPYLLRSYFADNLPLLVDDNEFYTELLPKGGLSKHEKAFMLLLSLSLNELKRDEIDLDEVSRENIANYISDNVEDVELHQSDIHVVLRREFNGNTYEENIYYSISPKNHSPQIHYYTFETTQNEILGMCLEDDLYHKYHKGMLITLHSRAYRIEEFNHSRKKIIVEFIPTTLMPYYHIDKEIEFDHIYDHEIVLFNKEKNGINLFASNNDIDFYIRFLGYKEIDSEVKTRLNETAIHHYKRKNGLFLRFSRSEGFTDEFRKAFIYLMNEVLKVYFPRHYHMIDIKEEDREEKRENFSFWILEMSKLNYHLLSTIIEDKYFQKILMLMEDVILWSRETGNSLTYGTQKEEDSGKDFDGLQIFLSQYLISANEITLYRKSQNILKQTQNTIDKIPRERHYCDFCGNLLPAGQYERLSDGRERCNVCSQNSSLKRGIDPITMLKEALVYLEKNYGITINEEVNIEIISSELLHQKIGKQLVVTDGFDPRAVGIAIEDQTGKRILLENGAPYFREMGVLVHELTHIWQYDNLDIEDIPDRLKVLEGHAMYVELEFLKTRFAEQKNYIESEMNRNDMYGTGYRYIRDLLENNRVDNPFVLLKEKRWK
jgi:hypothetical protein